MTYQPFLKICFQTPRQSDRYLPQQWPPLTYVQKKSHSKSAIYEGVHCNIMGLKGALLFCTEIHTDGDYKMTQKGMDFYC